MQLGRSSSSFSDTLRVRRLFWLREQIFWELENAQSSPCLAALVGHFEWEHDLSTAWGGLGTSAPAFLRLHSADFEAAFVGFFPLDSTDG